MDSKSGVLWFTWDLACLVPEVSSVLETSVSYMGETSRMFPPSGSGKTSFLMSLYLSLSELGFADNTTSAPVTCRRFLVGWVPRRLYPLRVSPV